jgi:hypothetical protein
LLPLAVVQAAQVQIQVAQAVALEEIFHIETILP